VWQFIAGAASTFIVGYLLVVLPQRRRERRAEKAARQLVFAELTKNYTRLAQLATIDADLDFRRQAITTTTWDAQKQVLAESLDPEDFQLAAVTYVGLDSLRIGLGYDTGLQMLYETIRLNLSAIDHTCRHLVNISPSETWRPPNAQPPEEGIGEHPGLPEHPPRTA